MSLGKRLKQLLIGQHNRSAKRTKPRTLEASGSGHAIILPALTPREKEVVQLIRQGYSNKQVANELGISVSTVKWNMTNILAKFEVESSKQLIALLSNQNADRDWKIIG
ncbi:MAG TPA: helix-turn-helix transcriptional regulator [Anaerolineae bacterium]|nr:helix-turn-helix transcriptional regulator [Anaerolineae bacterium]